MLTRREMLLASLGATGNAGVAAALVGVAAGESEHEGDGDAAIVTAFGRALADCTQTGTACLQRCLERLAAGDTSLAECARAVHRMLAICGAAGAIAAAPSRHRPSVAALCARICGDCEQACREHEQYDATYGACAEACAATVRAARMFTA